MKKVDAYVLGPKDYEEIPELTDEFFRTARPFINGEETDPARTSPFGQALK